MEAWIETSEGFAVVTGRGSRLLHGGVDWNWLNVSKKVTLLVASFMEAWIETSSHLYLHNRYFPSPPSWRRGLKLIWQKRVDTGNWVASFMEAWIETGIADTANNCIVRRLLHGGVDWNRIAERDPNNSYVASFMEAWIETSFCATAGKSWCRLLHGGVDWNSLTIKKVDSEERRLLHGGVDWNGEDIDNVPKNTMSPPSWRRGLKRGRIRTGGWNYCQSPPSWRRGLKLHLRAERLAPPTKSPPSWRRGLKPGKGLTVYNLFLSPPSWRRGLKPLSLYYWRK